MPRFNDGSDHLPYANSRLDRPPYLTRLDRNNLMAVIQWIDLYAPCAVEKLGSEWTDQIISVLLRDGVPAPMISAALEFLNHQASGSRFTLPIKREFVDTTKRGYREPDQMRARQPMDRHAVKQQLAKFEIAFLKARSGNDDDAADKVLAEVINLLWAFLDAKGSAKELETKAVEGLLENAPTVRQIVRSTIRHVGPTELARFRSSPTPTDLRRLRVYYPPPPVRAPVRK